MAVSKQSLIRTGILLILMSLIMIFAGIINENNNAYALNPGDREVESNNQLGLANSIAVNNTYYGSIANYYDYDCFFFRLNSAGSVALNLKHEGRPTDSDLLWVEIYDSNRERIACDFIDAWRTDYTTYKIGLPAGIYYIQVNPSFSVLSQGYGNIGYSINVKHTASSAWETEYNDSLYSADSISLNKYYYGTSIEYDDYDYYKFTLNSKRKVTVQFKHGSLSKDAYDRYLWEVYLLDSNRDTIKYDYVKGGDGTLKFSFSSLPAGTYYVKVEPYGSISYSTSTYSINVMVPTTSAPSKVYVSRYGHDDVKVSWSKVSGASGYYVYYKRTGYSKWTYLGSTTGSYYKKANLTDGALYKFLVLPYVKKADGKYSGYSRASSTIYALKKVPTPKVSKSGTKAKVYWSKVIGADGYYVAQYVKSNGKYVKVKGYYTKYTNKVFTGKKGRTYYYRVMAYDNVGDKRIFAPYSSYKGRKH